MPTSLHKDSAYVFPVACHNPDGSLNTTAAMTITTATGNVVARMNPSNNREAGVLGVVAGTSPNVVLHAPTGPGGADRTASMVFQIEAPLVDNSNAEFGPLGPEIAPPSWLL